MKILDLFAGTKSISNTFKKYGHDTFSIDWDTQHSNIDWYVDIGQVQAKDILERFGQPSVIWASPDCKTYSVAGIYHHRRKEADGNLIPISDYAKFCDEVNAHVVQLIKALNPLYFFIENPRAGLRKMSFMKDIPLHTVTYCQYGTSFMKPSDIFTNHPDPQFKAPCKNGDTCHTSAPRGSMTGVQAIRNKINRSIIPNELCEHIVKICTDSHKED